MNSQAFYGALSEDHVLLRSDGSKLSVDGTKVRAASRAQE